MEKFVVYCFKDDQLPVRYLGQDVNATKKVQNSLDTLDLVVEDFEVISTEANSPELRTRVSYHFLLHQNLTLLIQNKVFLGRESYRRTTLVQQAGLQEPKDLLSELRRVYKKDPTKIEDLTTIQVNQLLE